MAKKIVQPVEVQASVKGDSSVKSFKAQIKEAQQEALRLAAAFGETDARTLAAAQRVAELKDRMDDVNATIAGLHPDKFQAIANITSTLANGFAAAQGAAALLGGESEDLQRAMVKVQGAMAFAQGISSLKDLKFNLGGIGTMITGTVIPALRTMQGVIAASGIIALISGIAYYLYDAAKGADELTAAEARNVEQAKKLQAEKERDQRIGEVYAKLQSKIAQDELKRIEDQMIKMDLAGKKRIEILNYQADELKYLNDRLTTDWVMQSEAEREASRKAIVEIRNLQKEVNYDIQRENKRLSDEAAKRRQDELNKQKLHSLDILGDLNRASLSMQKILNDAMERNAKSAEETTKKYKENLASLRTSFVDIENEFAEIDENQKKAAEQREMLRVQGALATVDLLDSIFMNANAKNDAERKKEFERRKIFEAASTIISTYSAAQQAYASQMSIPTPDAPIRAQVAAAIAIAQGLARVVMIKKQQFQPSGNLGGNMPGGGGGLQPPSLPSQASTLGGGSQFAGQQATRVYVTEGDITQTQRRVKMLKSGSRI